jgi:hypothetical protein
MLYFLLFAIVALGQNSGAIGQGNLQYGELAFTETQSLGVNATRMTIQFSISAFQNFSLNQSQSASLAMNQVLEVMNQLKAALGQHNSVENLITTQLNVVEQNCNSSSHCPPGPNSNFLNNTQNNNNNATAAPTTPPVNGTAEPIINGTTPPIVNGTTPPINGTTPPINGTSAPIINGTVAPVNGTLPAVNVTTPPINVTTPPINFNNSWANVTFQSGWGYQASMQLTFDTNITEGQQLILQLMQLGGPYVALNSVSFGAVDTDLQTARSNATDQCLSGLRRQAEDMMNNLQVCFVNWKKIWVTDLSDTTPVIFPGLVDRFTNWQQQQEEQQEMVPSTPGAQTVKISISAIARFQECANNTNNNNNNNNNNTSSSTGSAGSSSSTSTMTGTASTTGGVSGGATGGVTGGVGPINNSTVGVSGSASGSASGGAQ